MRQMLGAEGEGTVQKTEAAIVRVRMSTPLTLTHDRLSLVRSRTRIKVTYTHNLANTVDTVCAGAKLWNLGELENGT